MKLERKFYLTGKHVIVSRDRIFSYVDVVFFTHAISQFSFVEKKSGMFCFPIVLAIVSLYLDWLIGANNGIFLAIVLLSSILKQTHSGVHNFLCLFSLRGWAKTNRYAVPILINDAFLLTTHASPNQWMYIVVCLFELQRKRVPIGTKAEKFYIFFYDSYRLTGYLLYDLMTPYLLFIVFCLCAIKPWSIIL